jgi:hypothetical protein
MPCHQSSLALDRWLRFKARPRQGNGQSPGRFVLVKVAGFELDQVHLTLLPDALEVPASEDRTLAKVRAKVVDEHPTVDVASPGGTALQSNRFH